MYGGIDYTKQYVNNATRRDFQVGSTFKPFVFTSAVQRLEDPGRAQTITPNTVYDGTNKRPVQGWNGGRLRPANEDDASYGQITVAPPPTSPSTRCTRRWPSTWAPPRSSRPPSTSASPPTPPT